MPKAIRLTAVLQMVKTAATAMTAVMEAVLTATAATVMEAALEAGADDFNSDGDVFEIYTDANDVGKVAAELEAKGYTFLSAEAAYLPTTTTELNDEESVTKMEKLIDMLEENDDVQNIWHNWEAKE